jgi:hypothetical protein
MKPLAPETKEIPLKDLALDKHVQMRASVSTIAVQDYADAMAEGDEFPAIIVYGRIGMKHYVADGFHRVLAARKAGRKTIKAEVRDGGKREAMLFAMRANAAHGVRRTNADKQKAVEACLHDKEWVKWTDTEIARRCAVSPQLVGRLREHMGRAGVRIVRTYVTSGGNVRTRMVPYRQPTRNIGNLIGQKLCPYCKRPMPKAEVGRIERKTLND